MSENALQRLELQIDRLLQRCQMLEAENLRLQQRETSLVAERAQLLQVRDSTRAQIEAMISRLKAMEQN